MALRRRLPAWFRETAGGLPRPFWTLWTGALVNRMGTFVVPFLALYLTERRGLTVARAGVVASLYFAGTAAAQPFAGWAADRIGRRATMVGALSLGGLAMIGLGLARSPPAMAAAAFAAGFLGESYRPALQAAVGDLVPPGERLRAFGLVYWAVNLGFAVGNSIGGFVASVSYAALFIGDGATTLLFALLVHRGVPETRPRHPPAGAAGGRGGGLRELLAPFADPPLLGFLGLTFLVGLVFYQHQLALPVDMAAHGIPKASFGAILALNGVVIVLVQPLAGRALSRRDRTRVLAAAVVLVGLGFGLNAVARTAPLYALGVVLWSLGEIGTLPLSSATVADLSPAAMRGRYQAAYILTFGIAGFLAPLLGSLGLERLGSTAVWTGCLGVALAVSAGYLALGGALRRAVSERAPGVPGHSPR